MPREPNKNIDKAREMYENGIKLIDIAKKLDVPAGTVRRWKCTQNWDNNSKGQYNKQTKKSKKVVASEVKAVMKNTELNEKQQLFCLYFIQCFNATKAYQKAYQANYETAMVRGCELLKNPKIKQQIEILKQNKLNQAFLSEADIFQKYLDIAFADMTDYVIFGNEQVKVKDGVGGVREVTISHLNLKNDYEVDGSLITEIRTDKDGVRVKLADKLKALECLTAHMSMATEEQKAKIALLKAQKDKIASSGNEKTEDRLEKFFVALEDELKDD